jgi:RNA polymerase sigma factor (TIGR02999 family)
MRSVRYRSDQVPRHLSAALASGMSSPSPSHEHVTALLRAWHQGDRAALDELLPLVYRELHQQAQRFMRAQSPGHTLQVTGLVHEAYLRLLGQEGVEWQSRAHFFGVAGKAMRSILVDHARTRHAAKRGRAPRQLTLGAAGAAADPEPAVDVLALDEVLTRLAAMDPEKGRLVELRYFAGLGIEETAAVLGLSPATVKRQWQVARAWLMRELSEGQT